LHCWNTELAPIADCFQWQHLSVPITFNGIVCCESMLHVAVCEITGR